MEIKSLLVCERTEAPVVWGHVHSILLIHENFWDCRRKKRPLSKCCVVLRWTGNMIWPGKKKISQRIFALIPVVVWEGASETLSVLLMLLHLFSFARGGWIFISPPCVVAKMLNLTQRKQSTSRTLQSIWAPMAKTGWDVCAAPKGFMLLWWFTPCLRRYRRTGPGEGNNTSREGNNTSREGNNTSNRTENRELCLQMSSSESPEVW